MKTIVLLLALALGIQGIAQERPFSASLSYPLPVGDNFLSAYTGIADVGIHYSFLNENVVVFGLGLNANYFRNVVNLAGVDFKDNFWLVQPKLIAELHKESLNNFVPFIGVGYTLAGFNTKVEGFQEQNRSDSFGGINLNLGVNYNFSQQWFAHLQYDYVRLSRDTLAEDSFANNIALIKVGVGYRF